MTPCEELDLFFIYSVVQFVTSQMVVNCRNPSTFAVMGPHFSSGHYKCVFFLAAALVLDSDHLAFDHLHHHRRDSHPVPPHREGHM